MKRVSLTSVAMILALVTGLYNTTASADLFEFSAPDFDRWVYPFNAMPGSRPAAPTFGAIGDPGFDQRDGQFLVGFNTAAVLPAVGPGQSYQINSVQVTATHSFGSFEYDPTYDPYATYLDPNDSEFVADSDEGRPILLTGAGLRNGHIAFTFNLDPNNAGVPFYEEDDPFTFGPPGAEVRNTYAFSPDAPGNGDVSNNVLDAFDFVPFAVGTTGLSPGDPVDEGVLGASPGSTFTFDVDLRNSQTLDYVAAGLAHGGLFFTISSLHAASQEQGGTNPNFYTAENFDPGAIAPTLTLDVSVIPEPVSIALLAYGGVSLGLRPRRRTKQLV